MSDIDSKPTTAEGRIASSGRDALARAEASGRLDRLVQATISSAAAAAPPAPPSRPKPAPTPAFGTRWPLAVGTAALAGVVGLTWFTAREVTSEPLSRPSSVSTTTAAAPAFAAHEGAPPSSPPAATPPGVAVTSLPDVVDAKRAAGAASSAMRQSSSAPAQVVPAAAANGAREVQEDAAVLFERANTARRGGDHAAAEKLYAHLVDTHPASREATTSRVILGRMQLAHGAATEALASFDAYLAGAPGGTLVEQALIGRAQSLQALGRRSEERAAWRALLEAFPSTASRQTALERSGDSP
ncbi:MAG: hypothetical protein K0S65_2241 [Labilithrix sp.]|nr:hypothetical protein [Labilithrix sp.]